MPGDRLPPLTVRLLLDAEEAILYAAEAIPAPGREGHIGVLSAPGGVMTHVAAIHSSWLTWYLGGVETARIWAVPDETGYAAGVERFRVETATARQYVEALDGEALREPLWRSTRWGEGTTTGYIVRRAIAHLFAHAGDLTVIGSLVGMPDLSLPGPLARSQLVDAADTSMSSLVPLLLDGLDEMRRLARALPAPAQVGAFARLNPGSFIVAHVGNREDLLWNQVVRGRPRDPWLEAADVGRGAPRSVPDWGEAIESLDRTIEAITPTVEALSASDLTRTVEWNGVPGPLSAQLARSAAHVFYHAGELQALGSLAGMPDLGLPGRLARCKKD